MKTKKVAGFTLFSNSLDSADFKEIKTENKVRDFIIPNPRFGDLISYFLIFLIALGFLSIFMEFPSLHLGNVYIQKNGKWIQQTKPFFHKPFQFNGKYVDDEINSTLSSY